MRQVVGSRIQPENHKNKLPGRRKDTEVGQCPEDSAGRARTGPWAG